MVLYKEGVVSITAFFLSGSLVDRSVTSISCSAGFASSIWLMFEFNVLRFSNKFSRLQSPGKAVIMRRGSRSLALLAVKPSEAPFP